MSFLARSTIETTFGMIYGIQQPHGADRHYRAPNNGSTWGNDLSLRVRIPRWPDRARAGRRLHRATSAGQWLHRERQLHQLGPAGVGRAVAKCDELIVILRLSYRSRPNSVLLSILRPPMALALAVLAKPKPSLRSHARTVRIEAISSSRRERLATPVSGAHA
jgi:hypothetical protein